MHDYSIGNRQILQTYNLGTHVLCFVEIPDSNKLAIASDDELVQKWINELHKKVVKPKDVKYVVAAAKRAFATDDPVASAMYSKKPKEDASVVTDVSHMAQIKWGESIEITYDVDLTIPHNPSVYAELKLPNGSIYKGEGNSKREARIAAAKEAFKGMQDLITDEDCEDDED